MFTLILSRSTELHFDSKPSHRYYTLNMAKNTKKPTKSHTILYIDRFLLIKIMYMVVGRFHLA